MEKFMALKTTSVLDEEKEKALENKIDRLDFDFNAIYEVIKSEIERNQKETDKLEKEGCKKVQIEIRRSHIYKHSNDLTRIIGEYKSLQCENRNKEKEILERAYQVVNPSMGKKQIEKFAKKGSLQGVGNTPFSVRSKSSQEVLEHANNRKRRVDKIVKSIVRLTALIDEIDQIVNSNTKYVDEIGENMVKSEMNTEQTNKELDAALEYQRRVNFLKKVLTFVAIGIVIVVILYVALRFFPSGNKNNNNNNNNNNNQ